MTEHDSPIHPSQRPLLEEAQLHEAQAHAAEGLVRDAPAFIERGTREFFWANVALFAAGFATFALLYCVQPILPLFSAEFGVSPAEAALSLSATTMTLAASLLVAGSLSEVLGRKRVMAASMVSAALLSTASAFAPTWGSFLVLRALAGLAFSGLPATAMAYIGEEMDGEVAGKAMGLYIGGTGLGALGGRVLGSALADHAGWRTALFALGLLSLAAAAVFWMKLPPSRHFKPHPLHAGALVRSAGAHLKDPLLLALFLEAFLLLGAYLAFFNFLGYRLTAQPYGFSPTWVGMLFLLTLVGSFTAGYTADLAGRRGKGATFCVLVALMLGGVAVTLAAPLWAILAGTVVVTFAFYGAHSVASGWVSLRAAHGKSQAASFYLFAYYTGSSLFGWCGGYAWSGAAWPGVTALIAGVLGVALVLAVWMRSAETKGRSAQVGPRAS